MLPYRLLYNQDCTNLFAISRQVRPDDVDQMVDEIADSGVEVLLLNPNSQRVNYPSNVWQTYWDGYEPGKRSFFGPIPEEEVPRRDRLVNRMKQLADSGCDYMDWALTRCRKRGIALGISVRMNDMHDKPWPGSHLFSRFYMQHPEFHLSNPPHLGWSSTALDYSFPEVRAHFLALIGELVGRYDFAVLELDFLRFPGFFPRDGAYEIHAKIMTDFLREVRALLRNEIALTCRVPATPAGAYELGLDLSAWAREGLIDAVTVGCFFVTGWQIPVDQFRALLGPDLALYVSSEVFAGHRAGQPPLRLPLEERLLHAFAAGYLAAGANGFELFNFFVPREDDPNIPLCFDKLANLKHLESLLGLPKTYLLSSGVSQMEADGPIALPIVLESAQSRLFELWMAAEPEAIAMEIVVSYESPFTPANLWLHFNGRPLGAGIAREKGSVVCQANSTLIKEGKNEVLLRNEGSAITITGLEIVLTSDRPAA